MQQSDPRWYRLAWASRWPAAVVLASWGLSLALLQLLRHPIPIGLPLAKPLPVRLEGGITVDRIVVPVAVGVKDTVSVQGGVVVRNDRPLTVDAGTVVIEKPLSVNARVQASQALPVVGSVNVGTIRNPVPVTSEEPFPVKGTVGVSAVEKPIDVSVSGALKSLNPFK
jgi:hypothetical protein